MSLNAISLVDSDQDDDFDLLFPEDSLSRVILTDSPATSSTSSSSSSSPTSTSASASDDESPLAITHTSTHSFPTYAAVKQFANEHAKLNGFEVRFDPSGGENSKAHGGTIRCWCWKEAPQQVKEEVVSSVPPLRKVHVKTSARGGKQIKCGCTWSISFYRNVNGDYVITTDSRHLCHTGHSPLSPSELSANVDSLRNVTPEIQEQVRSMINSGMRGVEAERRYLMKVHNITIERDVFHNLVKKTKRDLGIVDSSEDFKGLLYWLQGEMASRAAVARMRVDDQGSRVTAVFYQSADMIHHLDRNGQVLMMDTTFKTNRFGWPLLLICGVDQHNCTVLLAVAIMQNQTTDCFSWALQHMRTSVSEEMWDGVATVITDGDAAMAAAIDAVIPRARHIRCRYHLEINLRSNLLPLLGVIRMEEFITAWKGVVGQETEAGFTAAKKALHAQFQPALPYLEKNHWINEQQFAECYIAHLTTFGIRSTARVESWNSLLKGMLQVNSTTSLAILFQSLQFAASEVDRRALKRAAEEAARLPPPLIARTFDQEVNPHLTYYAAGKVKSQFALQHNYDIQQKVVAGQDSVWWVWDRRPMDTKEEKREVQAKDEHMSCTCGYPSATLLPCRHVFVVNLYLYKTAFRRGQVGKRWLKYYKPTALTPRAVEEAPAAPLDTTIPSFIPTLQQAGTLPARNARYGQLMGYCMTICTRGAEYKDMFHPTLTQVEALARWVEKETSEVGVYTVPPSAPASSSSSPVVPSGLHPTVGIEDAGLPSHKRKPKGRVKESRQQGAVEVAAKRARLTASQMS
jgi:hypothetical protein